MTTTRATRRLAAILAADVVGYSRMMGVDEAGTLDRLNHLRREVIGPLADEYGGRVVKTTGDGMIMEFASSVDAVAQAIEAQKRVSAWSAALPEAQRIALRIGVNVGDVIVEDGDLYGDSVNIAARLEGIAPAGGLCVSEAVHAQVSGKVGVSFDDLGPQALKNIAAPVRVFAWAPEGVARPRARTRRASVAVLPFDNLSNDPEQDFFVEGVSEDITTELSRFPQLFVIARNSALAFRNGAAAPAEIGAALGVEYLVTGAVRKAGERLRIVASLMRAETGERIWGDRFDGDLRDVFDLQDRVTAHVATAIEPVIEEADLSRARRKPPGNMDAYELFLDAKMNWNLGDSASAYGARRRLLDRSLELAPDYAPALALSCWYLTTALPRGFAADPEADLGLALARGKAVLASSTTDAASVVLGGWAVQFATRDPAIGREAVRRALRLNGNCTISMSFGALTLSSGAEYDEALSLVDRLLERSPVGWANFQAYNAAAIAWCGKGDHERSLDFLRQSLAINADREPMHYLSAGLARRMDRPAMARTAVENILRISPGARAGLVRRYHATCDEALRRDIVDGLLDGGLPE